MSTAAPNKGENEFQPDPNGPAVTRPQLLRLMAIWRQDADELIAAADPGKKMSMVGRPPITEAAKIAALERELAQVQDSRQRAENLARARALLTARRDLLDLMR